MSTDPSPACPDPADRRWFEIDQQQAQELDELLAREPVVIPGLADLLTQKPIWRLGEDTSTADVRAQRHTGQSPA